MNFPKMFEKLSVSLIEPNRNRVYMQTSIWIFTGREFSRGAGLKSGNKKGHPKAAF